MHVFSYYIINNYFKLSRFQVHNNAIVFLQKYIFLGEIASSTTITPASDNNDPAFEAQAKHCPLLVNTRQATVEVFGDSVGDFAVWSCEAGKIFPHGRHQQSVQCTDNYVWYPETSDCIGKRFISEQNMCFHSVQKFFTSSSIQVSLPSSHWAHVFIISHS